MLNKAIQRVSAFAPATCANVAVGFDILGFALANMGDTVTLEKRADRQIKIVRIDGPRSLPIDPSLNTASFVVKRLCQDLQLPIGFSIYIHKGIPLSSGLGGSAASAVAALVALNAFLHTPLSNSQLLAYAIQAEQLVSGQPHADNVVPSLYGGFTLIAAETPLQVVPLPIPAIYCSFIHPLIEVATKNARMLLRTHVTLKEYVRQSAYLATFIAALYQQDQVLLKYALNDILIEPQRAHLVPEFYPLKQIAQANNALGVSLSGSGPTIFALADTHSQATIINQAMKNYYTRHQITSTAWVCGISSKAAHITDIFIN
jgi:homoserine kinase